MTLPYSTSISHIIKTGDKSPHFPSCFADALIIQAIAEMLNRFTSVLTYHEAYELLIQKTLQEFFHTVFTLS